MAIDFKDLTGWEGHDTVLLQEAYAALPDEYKEAFGLVGKEPFRAYPMGVRRTMLFEITRAVLGQDTPNYAQQIGDCTSFGAKNVTEYLTCCQIALGGQYDFKNIFPPFFYGASRVLIGGGQLGWSDGSLGSWTAQAAQKYGVLFNDDVTTPYSGSIAKSWGSSGPPSSAKTAAADNPVKKVAMVQTWEDMATAIENMYPVAVCSNVGFDMKQRSDGFMWNSDTWNHCMAIVGFDDGGDGVEAHACILNSWGDVFGEITDFRDKTMKWPKGTLRVRKKDVEKMLSQQDSWSYSDMDAFLARALPIDFFSPF